jgi:Fur family transcriptional regulator, ferric uptake regulator
VKRPKSKSLPCGRPEPTIEEALPADEIRAKLEAFLLNKKLKRSVARDKILSLIIENTGHFRIHDLLNRVEKAHSEIGAATVYRSVSLFVSAQIIRETLTLENGEKLFELAVDRHHDHIVCTKCNRVFEFHEKIIESAQDRLGKKLNFKPVNHRHIIYADCLYLR